MGRPVERQSQLITVVRAAGVTALTVVGAAPYVARVVGLKPTRFGEFMTEEIDAEGFSGGQLWPTDMFTPAQLIYGQAWIVDAAALRPVDLLVLGWGAAKYGTSERGYFVWQAAARDALTRLSVMEMRGALASRWVEQWRTTYASPRGIRLR
jgi:hypothetical protein